MSKTSNIGGILAMIAATALFVIGDSFMKIVTEGLPPFEVLFLRGIAASAACAALVTIMGEWRAASGVFNTRTLLRAMGETASTMCYIVALSQMPIADVVAILQTAPLILILGVGVLLREKIGATRVMLALVGFAGAVLVAQPGSEGFTSISLLAFGSALLISARDLVGRGVPTTIPITVIAFATTVMVMAVSGIASLAIETWVSPDIQHLTFLAIAGLFVAFGQAGLLIAYRLGETASVAPFFYSFALWGVVAGLVVWGELPNGLALFGIGLIVASGIAIVVVDRRKRGASINLADAL